MKRVKKEKAGDAVEAGGGVALSFFTSGGRPSARYVSGSTVYEEALDGGQWLNLYWSAGGQVQRENLTVKLPGLNPITRRKAFSWKWTARRSTAVGYTLIPAGDPAHVPEPSRR